MEDGKPTKLYYSISEVSELSGIKPHILRFWEKDFSVLRPKKNRAGNRAYKERDLRIVLAIKQLLYQEKYTIKGARDRLLKDRSLLQGIEIEGKVPDSRNVAASSGVEPGEKQAWIPVPQAEKAGCRGGEAGDGGDVEALVRARRLLDEVRSGLRDLLEMVGGQPGGGN